MRDPVERQGLALNVTTVNATTTGNVRLYPSGLAYQPLGTANAYKVGYARANQTFGSIDGPTASSFTLFNDAPAGYPVDVIVDVQGYFAPGPNTPPQSGDSWFFTLRDPQNRPSTEYRWDSATPTTTLLRDYVYLGNLRVADYTWFGQPNGLVYYTNDHLGTPRYVTAGTVPKQIATYKFRAFGLALTSQIPGQGPEFAGMERDLASSDLYDHARFMGGKLPRFNSPDKLGGHVEDPQSWNRYAYARNNPLKYVDPDGQSSLTASDYAAAFVEAAGKTLDDMAFVAARPMLRMATGILNNDAGEFAGGAAEVGAQGLVSGVGGFFLSKAEPALSLLGRNPEAPVVLNRSLQNTIDALFRGKDQMAGGTAGAILKEAQTGVPVGNAGFHLQKGIERAKNLGNILQSQNLTAAERRIAEQLKKELDDAVRVYRTTSNAVNQ
ncbi:MAG: RHS repeat-associated core domain-containing protein [Thermoanaerobaculia bacterium]